MKRRTFLAAAASLAMPGIGRAAAGRTLRFVPQSDVGVTDPTFTSAYVTRNHGFLIYDTLFGMDGGFRISPQMVAGETVEADGSTWRLNLRDGLRFHDGTPVLARDAVASVKRWWRRDAFGQALRDATNEVTARSDTEVEFRLKQPFRLLSAALGKTSSYMPAIMPEWLASGDPDHQIPELIGSGPFRFVAGEHVSGSRLVYERFDGYRPRLDGVASGTAGPKIAHVDRVEWRVISDPGTAAAALKSGEVDWWEKPIVDLIPDLRARRDIRVDTLDREGSIAIMRFNQLQPPFDNPEIRRIVLRSVSQADFMMALAGDDRTYWREGVGVFTPGSPLANDEGLEVLTGPRDLAAAKRALAAAGYKGERVALLAPSDYPSLFAFAQVTGDLLTRIGFTVDLQSVDWGTVQQRRLKRTPADQGGWSIYCTFVAGLEAFNPASHQNTRGLGLKGSPGWPDSAKLEALRTAWFAAATSEEEKRIARQMQRQVFEDVPFIPLGQYFEPTAFRKDLSDILSGIPLFYNLKMA